MGTAVVQRSTRAGLHRRVRAVGLEIALVSGVFMLYRSGRLFTRDAAEQALANAQHVIGLERALGIFNEGAIQGWALGSPSLVSFLNHYYVLVHFPATLAFLIWAYARHRGPYRIIRSWFVAVTLAALVLHVAFPLAPPRMTTGFVDTLREFGPSIYDDDPRRSVSNQFAAMPSLHFGWALMLAVGFVAITRTRRSIVVVAHPAITLLAIVATGNHYWLDAAFAALVALVVGVAVAVWVGPRALDDVGRFEVTDAAASISPADKPSLVAILDGSARGCPSANRHHERCRQRTATPNEHADDSEDAAIGC